MDSNIGTNNPLSPDTDRDISSTEKDSFGFTEIARKLAPSLIAATETDGMVIGIEGKWGSGKTSLLNFLTAELRAKKDEHLHVLYLPPWLHGDTNSLIDALLSQMIPPLEAEELKNTTQRKFLGFSKKQAAKSSQIMKRYAVMAGRGLSPLMKLGGIFLPALDQVGEAVERGSDYLDKYNNSASVSDLKKQITEMLIKSKLKFVVLIDDLDRLEPNQTNEVIRLVRSVADFPKVVYCLCYDRNVLTHALEHGLNVQSGHSYLEKIVQQTFSMPLPEPFDLRHSLYEKLLALYKSVNGKSLSDEEANDLRNAIDIEGSRLEVPRDIPRVLNAIKISYPQITGDVYFPDVCWIQLIRCKRPELYFWIENYLAEHSVLTTTGAVIGKTSRIKMGAELQKLLPDTDDVSSPNSIWKLVTYIPGIEANGDSEKCVFQSSTKDNIDEFIVKKRIGSPIHSRLYFAFAIPKTSMHDKDWEELAEYAEVDVDRLKSRLAELANKKRPVGGSWFSHVLDRLDMEALQDMSAERLSGWAIAICDCMDEVLEHDNDISAFRLSTASKTTISVRRLIKQLRVKDETLAKNTIAEIFENGRSMNWLVGYWFRRELFDHGLGGDRSKPDACALTADEMKKTVQVLKSRLSDKSLRSNIYSFPELPEFLFGWRDLAGIRSPKIWVKKHIVDDRSFLELLLGMRNWVVSDRVHYKLKKENIEPFMDWDDVLKRTTKLSSSSDTDIAELAQQVISAINFGDSE